MKDGEQGRLVKENMSKDVKRETNSTDIIKVASFFYFQFPTPIGFNECFI